MPADRREMTYVGIHGTVVALDDASGAELWRVVLRGADYVSLLWDGEALLAACAGEVWRLDPRNGAIVWHNELKGMGRGYAGLATTRRAADRSDADTAAAQHHLDAARAAAS